MSPGQLRWKPLCTQSTLATTQADHATRLMVLKPASKAHLYQVRQHQLRIEDSENRSCRNNNRLKGIPKATSGTDLRPTAISILNQVLGREASSSIELDRVHRVGGPGGDRGGCPRDVLCRVHYYTLKEELLQSRNSRYMQKVVRPLLIRQAVATYTWGHPFSIKVASDDNKFILSDPDQLPDFILFLKQDPIDVPNWLDPPENYSRPLEFGPLSQCHRCPRSSSPSSGPRTHRPTSPAD